MHDTVTGDMPGSSLAEWMTPPQLPLPRWTFMFLRLTIRRLDWSVAVDVNIQKLSFSGQNLGWFQNSLQYHSLVTGKPVFQQPLPFTYFFHSHQFIFAVLGNIAKSPLDGGRHCKSLIPKLILQQGTCSGQPSHSANTTRIFFLPEVCSISCMLSYPKVNYQIYCILLKIQNT